MDIPRIGMSSSEVDLGRLLIWDCPKCETENFFHLVSSTATLSVATIRISKPTEMVSLRCSSCLYEIRVEPSEASLLQPIIEFTEKYLINELSKEAYCNIIRAVEAQCIKDLIALTEEWECPDCNENNPATFLDCWSCAYKKTEAFDTFETPPFDEGGKNAWEL